MPGGDKTGPQGSGPMTGRRMGYCTGSDNPGNELSGRNSGRGFGRGGRFRFAWGNGRFSTANSQYVSNEDSISNELKLLREQMSSLEKQLSEIIKKG